MLLWHDGFGAIAFVGGVGAHSEFTEGLDGVSVLGSVDSWSMVDSISACGGFSGTGATDGAGQVAGCLMSESREGHPWTVDLTLQGVALPLLSSGTLEAHTNDR